MMAAVGELLRDRLIGNAALAARIGQRVHPDMLPQGTQYPAIRYYLISDVDVVSQPPTGRGAPPQIRRAHIQLDVYAASYPQVTATAAAALLALHGWIDRTQGIILARVTDTSDVQDSNETMHRVTMDVSITYKN